MTSTRNAARLAGSALALAFVLALPPLAGAQPAPEAAAPAPPQEINIVGTITARSGNHITVNGAGGETVVTVTDSTKVQETSGALNLSKTDRAHSELINGLPVNIKAHQVGSEIFAQSVSYKKGDMKVAQQVQAGTEQAKKRVRAEAEEMRSRVYNANQYVEKASTTVYFATGSAVVSAQHKTELCDLASQAKQIKGYWISVTGYTDTTGNPEANQRLSEQRARNVTRYMEKSCGVMSARVLAPDAMGQEHQEGDSESTEGKAKNRRVVVKVVTNKGLEGMSEKSPNIPERR